jgi:methylated-DNA-[protein]-cysteine S-methyltransferase
MIYSSRFETPLGTMVAAAKDETIIGLWFTTQKHFPTGIDEWVENDQYGVFIKLRAWLESYFKGVQSQVILPLEPQGTAFQKIVWQQLLKIPFGETTTYGSVARQVAATMGRTSMSAQAVGGAIGRNPISIVIPCHRVVGANNSLTGYAGGLDKKEALLEIEKQLRP